MADDRRAELRALLDDAAVGIGTMIVFIATVLVAAIAAGVLIDMSARLQSTSTSTGKKATEEVASNLHISKVFGLRPNSTADIETLLVQVTLSPGASLVDLNQTIIHFQTPTHFLTLKHVDAPPSSLGAGAFNVSKERDLDGSFTSARPVMTSGDFVNITVPLAANGAGLEARVEVNLDLVPEVGNNAQRSFQVPNTFGSDTLLRLV